MELPGLLSPPSHAEQPESASILIKCVKRCYEMEERGSSSLWGVCVGRAPSAARL